METPLFDRKIPFIKTFGKVTLALKGFQLCSQFRSTMPI